MLATRRNTDIPAKEKRLVDTIDLQAILCTGRATATRIGKEAGARVQIGRRVLWNVAKIQDYLDSISA